MEAFSSRSLKQGICIYYTPKLNSQLLINIVNRIQRKGEKVMMMSPSVYMHKAWGPVSISQQKSAQGLGCSEHKPAKFHAKSC